MHRIRSIRDKPAVQQEHRLIPETTAQRVRCRALQESIRLAALAMIASLLVSAHVTAQESNTQAAGERTGLRGLFRQQKSPPQAEPAQNRSGPNENRSGPNELYVIDRQTARRNAGQPAPNRATPSGYYSPSRVNEPLSPPQAFTPDGITSQQRIEPPVRQASYQDSMQRNYRSPNPNGSFSNAYDRPEGYSNFERPSYPAQSSPMFDSVMDANDLQQQQQRDRNLLEEREMRFGTSNSIPAEHPDSNPKYFESAPEQWSTNSHIQEFHNGDPRYIQESGYEHGNRYAPDQGYGQDMVYGQGYLNAGPSFRGSRLQQPPTMATERALELQLENQELQEALLRVRRELESRNQDWETSQSTIRRKDEELKLTLTRMNQLRDQLEQLTQERNLAVQEKIAIEKSFNDQLKEIETMLDGVLVNQLSDK